MDTTQKFAWIEYQIRQVTLGNLNAIACPYCGSSVVMGVEKLCCEPMGDATLTLLRSMEVADSVSLTGSVFYQSEALTVSGTETAMRRQKVTSVQ